MNPFEMVVMIVAISAVASVFRAKYGSPGAGMWMFGGGRRNRDERSAARPVDDAETMRLRDEVKDLKERLHVLERIATDNNRAVDLDREIERLR